MSDPAAIQDGPPLFAFERVGVERDGVALLREVSASVPATGISAVVGPSGAGKSTLLRLCNRLDVPTTGTVRFHGDDIAGLDPLWLRRRAGMVLQTPTLFAGTVRDNLLVAAPDADDEHRAQALRSAALDPALLDRAADTLSGGEAQRACLARTLATGPEVLLLDEPTSALDATPKRAFERVAVELAAGGIPMVWVTHDLAQVQRIADHVLALIGGALVFAGPVDELRHSVALHQFLSEEDRS